MAEPRRCEVCNESEGHAADCPWPDTMVGRATALGDEVRGLIDKVLSDTWIGRRIRRYWPESGVR